MSRVSDESLTRLQKPARAKARLGKKRRDAGRKSSRSVIGEAFVLRLSNAM